MNFEDQILTIHNLTVIFLSEYHFVITENPENVLSNEKVTIIDSNDKIKKTKTTVGTINFNVKNRRRNFIIHINEKQIPLDVIQKKALPFDVTDLKTDVSILCYTKEKDVYVAIANEENNYLYLNNKNVIKLSDIGNILHLGNITQNEFINTVSYLNELHIPFSKIVVDSVLQDANKFNFPITTTNSLSPNNTFYFLTDPSYKPYNTYDKQVVTLGFSKNNSLNYFDFNVSSTFDELKEYFNKDLNYNKNFFNYKKNDNEQTKEFLMRLIQLNCLLPISLIDMPSIVIDLKENDYHFKVFRKYLNLRHRLSHFLYSGFTEQEVLDSKMYVRKNNSLIIHKDLLAFPIFTEVNKSTNNHFIDMKFNDIYYDIETKEKIDKDRCDYFGINKMPLFTKAGSILPFSIPNTDSMQNGYEIQVYPNGNNQFSLHYKDKEQKGVTDAYTKFTLKCDETFMTISIKTYSNKVLRPRIFRFNFINIKRGTEVFLNKELFASKFDIDTKGLYVDIYHNHTEEEQEITLTNQYGLEIDRRQEFLERKIENFFALVDCNDKEKAIYKYKIKPYLHESIQQITNRIEKHAKFINVHQRKNLYKSLEAYKKD